MLYNQLRDTLICNTIQEATQIAFSKNGRNRVVTINGEIIELSGLITGGGNHARIQTSIKEFDKRYSVEQNLKVGLN